MPRRLTEDEKELIRKLQEQGMSDAEISEKLGIPPKPEVKKMGS